MQFQDFRKVSSIFILYRVIDNFKTHGNSTPQSYPTILDFIPHQHNTTQCHNVFIIKRYIEKSKYLKIELSLEIQLIIIVLIFIIKQNKTIQVIVMHNSYMFKRIHKHAIT